MDQLKNAPKAFEQLVALVNAWNETETLPPGMAPVLDAYRTAIADLVPGGQEWFSLKSAVTPARPSRPA